MSKLVKLIYYKYNAIYIVKSFYLCLHNDKICTTYVEIRIKSCHIWLNFKNLSSE